MCNLHLQVQGQADLNQPLDSTRYVLAIWTELCCCNWSLEAEVVQQYLSFSVDQQCLALDVNGKKQQAIRADAKSPELAQAFEWQCRPSRFVEVNLKFNRCMFRNQKLEPLVGINISETNVPVEFCFLQPTADPNRPITSFRHDMANPTGWKT